MLISVDKEALLKAVVTADSIISSKSINTILTNCLFNISKDEIEILSTDNEIAIRTKVDALSDAKGSFAVNGKKLSNILKELPNDELTVKVNDANLINIKTKSKDIKGNYTLVITAADEFPEIPHFTDDDAIEFDQGLLKEMLKKVTYAASMDVIKPVFNGVYMVSEAAGKLTAVATDSRRLAIITRPVDNSAMLKEGIIIPLKTVQELVRLLDNTGLCRLSVKDNQCFFQLGRHEIISRIVDGQFPNYKQVIPKEHAIRAVVETKKFIESLRRAMIFTREPSHKIVLHFGKENLVIRVNTPELGESEEEIPVESNAGEKMAIGVNCQFLIESLREIDSFSLACGITGNMSPVTINPEDDASYTAVIMPIQIKSQPGE